MKLQKSLLQWLSRLSVVVFCGVIGCTDTEDPVDENPFFENRVLNIAHRGGALLAPEETLVAFQQALDAGADALELDVHATSDGVVVCLHDSSVDRTTDGTGEVAEMLFDDLRALDAGYTYSPDEGETFPYRGTGLVVPTFEEVLDAFPDQYFVVEIKQDAPSIVTDVIDIIESRDLLSRMILGSSNDGVIAEVREAAPEALTSFAALEVLTFITLSESDEADYEPPAGFLIVPHTGIDEPFLERTERFELSVHAWTVNDRVDMEAMVEAGVDGIITDNPLLLSEVLGN